MACNWRFTCFLFLLHLLLLVSSLSSSSSKPLQGSRDHFLASQVLAATDDDVFSRGKGTDAAAADNYYNVGGRKMAGVTVSATNNKDAKKEAAAKVGATINGEESSKTKRSVGIGAEEEEEEGQVVHETGFVTFNADYHPPRHHPPKNN